jgi:hypothetical protein
MNLFIFRMKRSALGLYYVKQFEYERLLIKFNQVLKQNIELQFSRGRFIYIKSSIFGYASNFEVFIPSNQKSMHVYSRDVFQIQCVATNRSQVSTLVKGAYLHLRLDNSFVSDRSFGWL